MSSYSSPMRDPYSAASWGDLAALWLLFAVMTTPSQSPHRGRGSADTRAAIGHTTTCKGDQRGPRTRRTPYNPREREQGRRRREHAPAARAPAADFGSRGHSKRGAGDCAPLPRDDSGHTERQDCERDQEPRQTCELVVRLADLLATEVRGRRRPSRNIEVECEHFPPACRSDRS